MVRVNIVAHYTNLTQTTRMGASTIIPTPPPEGRACKGGTSTTLSMVMIVCMVMWTVTHAHLSHAAILPTTITSRSTVSMNDASNAAGTTLDVPSMLADAISNGATTAILHATRLEFAGTVTVVCPSTAAGWSTVPLDVLIEDGWSTTGTTPTYHIQVSGVLSLSSKIVIRGGTYTCNGTFLHVPNALTVQDGSTLSVDGGTHNLELATTTTYIFLVETAVVITNRGSVLIRTNTFTASDKSIALDWTLHVVYLMSSPINVTNDSVFSLTNNTVAITNVSFLGSTSYIVVLRCDQSNIYVADLSAVYLSYNRVNTTYGGHVLDALNINLYNVTNSQLTMVNESSFLIVTNAVMLHNWTIYTLQMMLIYATTSPTVLSSGSLITISGNSVDMQYVFVQSSVVVYTVLTNTLSPVYLSGNGSVFSVTDNVYTIAYTYAPSILLVIMTLGSGPLSLDDSTGMYIGGNVIIVDDATLSGTFTFYGMYISNTVYIGKSSIMSISNNSVSMANMTAGTLSIHLVGLFYATINLLDVGSTFAVDSNEFSLYNVTLTSSIPTLDVMLITRSTLNVLANSIVSVSRNSFHSTLNNKVSSIYVIQAISTLLVNGGTMAIVHNEFMGFATTSVLTVSELSGGGVITMSRNTIESTGSMMEITTLASPHPKIYTCANFVAGSPCVVTGDAYSCSIGTVLYSSVVEECTASQSITSSGNTSATPTFQYTSSNSPTPTTSVPPVIAVSETLSNSLLAPSPTVSPSLPVTASPTDRMTYAVTTFTPALTGPSLSNTSIRGPLPQPCSPTSTASAEAECEYSCSDVISAQLLSTNATSPGCAQVYIPYASTVHGAAVRVEVRIDPTFTASYNATDSGLLTTNPAIKAASVPQQSAKGLVALDVRRVDAYPMTAVSGRIYLPKAAFPACSTLSSSDTDLPWINVVLGAPPTALAEDEKAVLAGMATLATDLQTLAAVGLLRCSPGSDDDVESEAGIRALVPVALSATCAGAVQGAILAVFVAALFSGAMAVVRYARGNTWAEAAAITRCPGIAIGVWAYMQMGLVVCGGRLLTGDDPLLGAVGVVVGGVLPLVCVMLAWAVVSRRCYRLTQVPKAVVGRWKVVVWARSVILPSYELDANVYPVSDAYSSIVGRTRRPSCVWAGLPVLQPVVMLLAVFAEGSVCDVMLIIVGLLLLALGVCYAVFRPHQILAANHLQAMGMALNAAVCIIASRLVVDPLDADALVSYLVFVMIQVSLSILRTVHFLFYFGYMRAYRKEVFTICEPDDTLSSSPLAYGDKDVKKKRGHVDEEEGQEMDVRGTVETKSISSPTPVFDIHGVCSSPTSASRLSDTLLPDGSSSTNEEGGAAPVKATAFSKLSVFLFGGPRTNKHFAEIIRSNVHRNDVSMVRPTTLELDKEDEGVEVVLKHPSLSSSLSFSHSPSPSSPSTTSTEKDSTTTSSVTSSGSDDDLSGCNNNHQISNSDLDGGGDVDDHVGVPIQSVDSNSSFDDDDDL